MKASGTEEGLTGMPVLLNLCFFARSDDYEPKNVGTKADVAGRRPAPRVMASGSLCVCGRAALFYITPNLSNASTADIPLRNASRT
jgi:hypothetical protein